MKFVDFPYPPSANELYATINRRRVPSKKLRDFKKEAARWALRNRHELRKLSTHCLGIIEQGNWVKVDIHLCLPAKKIYTLAGAVRIYDASNRIKATHDALSDALGIDDKYFCVGVTQKVLTKGKERAIIEVSGKLIVSDKEVLENDRTEILHTQQQPPPSHDL